jgi:diaminopimelate epimerase
MKNKLPLTNVPFRKMHGLGNDFVIFDARKSNIKLTKLKISVLANRKTGLGFDQLLIMRPSKTDNDVFMSVYNADGETVETCGNGARCIAKILINESKKTKVKIDTLGGEIEAYKNNNGLITVSLSSPKFKWNEIPLSHDADTLNLSLGIKGIPTATIINVGNPHAVFFVEKIEFINLNEIGPKIEAHEIFPEKINVEFAQIINKNHIRMRVWERGVGVTQACGTGACATLVAAVRKNLTNRNSKITLDGGDLFVEWTINNNIKMTGPALSSFSGLIS